MYDIYDMTFKRKFAINLRKNLKFNLSRMTFSSDFVNGSNCNMYPILSARGVIKESVDNNRYIFSGNSGNQTRFIGQFFPYATYEISAESLAGNMGIVISNKQATVKILVSDNGIISAEHSNRIDKFDTGLTFKENVCFIITARVNNYDIYFKDNDIKYITTFNIPCMQNSSHYNVFSSTTVGLFLEGNAVLKEVVSYIDCGVTQADIRPIRYENGEIMTENGKVYFTVSLRFEDGCHQGILSWVPSTCEFELTGTLYYDSGDGIWGNDVAASVMYHRPTEEWYLWVCSFTHNHILGYSKCEGDIRFGVNAVDITLMEKQEKDSDKAEFCANKGDEDPDFVYDKSSGKWYMTICRKDDENKYRYYLYESANPFKGYKHKATTEGNEVTGGSIVRIGNKLRFVCGSGFDKTAEYHIYDIDSFQKYTAVKCDYHDGGFRGWGTIVPIKSGTRTRYYWLTFDRYKAGKGNWSYGNLYCYESNKYN